MANTEYSLFFRKILNYLFLSDPQRFSIGTTVGYAAHALATSISKHYNYIFLLAVCEAGWISWSIFFILLLSWKIVYQAISANPSFDPEIERLLKALAILDANNAPRNQKNKLTKTIVNILIDRSNNDVMIQLRQQVLKELAEEAELEWMGH